MSAEDGAESNDLARKLSQMQAQVRELRNRVEALITRHPEYEQARIRGVIHPDEESSDPSLRR